MNFLYISFAKTLFEVMEHCPRGQGLLFFEPMKSIPFSKEIIEEHDFVFSKQIQIYQENLGKEISIEEKRSLNKLELLLWKKKYIWKCNNFPKTQINNPCIFVEGPFLHYSTTEINKFENKELYEKYLEIEVFCFKSYNFQSLIKKPSNISAKEWREKASSLYSTTTFSITPNDSTALETILKEEGYSSSVVTKMINGCGYFLRTQKWKEPFGFTPAKIMSNVIAYEKI